MPPSSSYDEREIREQLYQASSHFVEIDRGLRPALDHGSSDQILRNIVTSEWAPSFGYNDERALMADLIGRVDPASRRVTELLRRRTAYYLRQLLEAAEQMRDWVATDAGAVAVPSPAFWESLQSLLRRAYDTLKADEIDLERLTLAARHADLSYARKSDEDPLLFTALFYLTPSVKNRMPTSPLANPEFQNLLHGTAVIWTVRALYALCFRRRLQMQGEEAETFDAWWKGVTPKTELWRVRTLQWSPDGHRKSELVSVTPVRLFDKQQTSPRRLLGITPGEALTIANVLEQWRTGSPADASPIAALFSPANVSTVWWALRILLRSDVFSFEEDWSLFPTLPPIAGHRDTSTAEGAAAAVIDLLIAESSAISLQGTPHVSADSTTPEIYSGFRTLTYIAENAIHLHRHLLEKPRYRTVVDRLEQYVDALSTRLLRYELPRAAGRPNSFEVALQAKFLCRLLKNYSSKRLRLHNRLERWLRENARIEISPQHLLFGGRFAHPCPPENGSGRDVFRARAEAAVDQMHRFVVTSRAAGEKASRPFNLFICGAPGSGKTYFAEQLLAELGRLAGGRPVRRLEVNLAAKGSRDKLYQQLAEAARLKRTSGASVVALIVDEVDGPKDWNPFAELLPVMWDGSVEIERPRARWPGRAREQSAEPAVKIGSTILIFIGSQVESIEEFEASALSNKVPKSKDFLSRLHAKVEIPAVGGYRDRIINGCIQIQNFMEKVHKRQVEAVDRLNGFDDTRWQSLRQWLAAAPQQGNGDEERSPEPAILEAYELMSRLGDVAANHEAIDACGKALAAVSKAGWNELAISTNMLYAIGADLSPDFSRNNQKRLAVCNYNAAMSQPRTVHARSVNWLGTEHVLLDPPDAPFPREHMTLVGWSKS